MCVLSVQEAEAAACPMPCTPFLPRHPQRHETRIHTQRTHIHAAHTTLTSPMIRSRLAHWNFSGRLMA
jgi:hypothetical protein